MSRRRAMRRDQRGIALIEFLIAMLLLSLTIGGIAAASITAGGTGKMANDQARLNVLMTAFGEAVKALPYERCPSADDYWGAFQTTEDALPDDVQDLQRTTDAQLDIVSVDSDGCPDIDNGTQTIMLQVQIRDEELVREIVKRTPDPGAQPLDVRIEPPIVTSLPNASTATWTLQAAGTSYIVQYEWWCDGAWAAQDPQPAPGPPDHITSSPTDGSAVCAYPAPSASSPRDQMVALRVTEDETNRTQIYWREFPLPTTLAPLNPPVAGLSLVPSPNCLQAAPCLPNTDITFVSSGPPPVGTYIDVWEWTFGDGTPTEYCSRSSADPNGLLCESKVHQYAGSRVGGYTATLVLIDNFGSRSNIASVNVHIAGPPIVRPTISVNSNLSGTPLYGVSPQRVTFDASGSHADGQLPGQGSPPGGITNYYWDFGYNGQIQSGANLSQVQFDYPQSQSRETYVARVTVTDTNGITNTSTVTIVLDPMVPPIAVRNAGGRKGDLPFIRNAYFDFFWTNVSRTAGDTMEVVIRITPGGGFCGFLGVENDYAEFIVLAGPPGTAQSYRAQFNSSPRGFNGVCSTDNFSFTALTRRTNGSGGESLPSPPQPLDPEFF